MGKMFAGAAIFVAGSVCGFVAGAVGVLMLAAEVEVEGKSTASNSQKVATAAKKASGVAKKGPARAGSAAKRINSRTNGAK